MPLNLTLYITFMFNANVPTSLENSILFSFGTHILPQFSFPFLYIHNLTSCMQTDNIPMWLTSLVQSLREF